MISADTLTFLNEPGRRYLLSTPPRSGSFPDELRSPAWQQLPDNPQVEVQLLERDGLHYLLARSQPRREKERAIRRRNVTA